MRSSYTQGHEFEQKACSLINCILNPNMIQTNALFQKYPTFEIDIVCISDGRIILIECKDYSGTVELQDNLLLYREQPISNFVKKFENKVKAFNKKFKVNAVGIILMGDDSIASGFPYWHLDDIPKLNKLLKTIPPNNVSSVLRALEPEKQAELRKGVTRKNGEWK